MYVPVSVKLVTENQGTKKEIDYIEACNLIRSEVTWPAPESTSTEEKIEYLHRIMHKYINGCTREKKSKEKNYKAAKHRQIKLHEYINRINKT